MWVCIVLNKFCNENASAAVEYQQWRILDQWVFINVDQVLQQNGSLPSMSFDRWTYSGLWLRREIFLKFQHIPQVSTHHSVLFMRIWKTFIHNIFSQQCNYFNLLLLTTCFSCKWPSSGVSTLPNLSQCITSIKCSFICTTCKCDASCLKYLMLHLLPICIDLFSCMHILVRVFSSSIFCWILY
jgi:hypothetical protein